MNVEITKADLEAVKTAAIEAAQKTAKDEIKKATSHENAKDALDYLETSEHVSKRSIVDAGLRIWNSNGFPQAVDAQSFARRPEAREKNRITYESLVGAIEDACKRLPQEEAFDNVGLPTNASILIPQMISEIIKEPIEPIMIGQNLLKKIRYSFGETITFPAVGAYEAAWIAPGSEYPEKTLDFAGYVTATIGKAGVKIRIPEEMLRYSPFDIMSIHLRAGARAMARHKERAIFDMVDQQGVTVFDNTGGTSLRGRTTGRGRNGEGNYTLTLDDLFTMYADLMNAGFIPDTLIMNPMGWLVFVLNETLRSFGFVNNGPLYGTWQGTPAQAPNWGGMGVSGGNAASTTPAAMNNSNLQGNVPTLFPAPLDIAVTPFQTFAPATQTTTITMCTRSELGYLIEDEPLVVESWDDPRHDIRSTKFRERYAVAMENEGHAVVNAKGIKIAKGYDFEDFQVSRVIGTGDLPNITGVVS